MVKLRDTTQTSTIHHVQVQRQGWCVSLAVLASCDPSPTLPWPSTWDLCTPARLSPTTSQSILGSVLSWVIAFNTSSFPRLHSRCEWLFLFWPISCLLLRPLASDHLSGLVRGDSSSSRINRSPSINHKLPEAKNSQVPSLNIGQSKDGATDHNSPEALHGWIS